MAIRDQQFIYHLTSIDNVPSIVRRGLLPRAHLDAGFTDIADPEIIEGRRGEALEQFVPFHWFAKNPFDGRVHMELLATVDWLLHEEGVEPTIRAIREHLKSWSGGAGAAARKSKLFDDESLGIALQKLSMFQTDPVTSLH